MSTVLKIKLTTDGQGNVTAALDSVEGKIKAVKPAAEEANGALEKIKGTLETIKGFMEAWGVFEIVKKAVEAFLEANAEAQRLQATLIGVAGSAQAARQAYEEITQVAENSLATSEQLTASWVRLANVGIAPTRDMLQSLANVAAETNQSVDTVANAVASAVEGHTRGLQQLGIQAEIVGDKMIVSFQGSSQIIENSKQGLTEYIQKLGEAPSAVAAQDAQVKSLGGAWDQLKKHVNDYFESVGDTSRLNTALHVATLLVDKFKELQQAHPNLGGLAISSPAALAASIGMAVAAPDASKLKESQQAAADFRGEIDRDIESLTGIADTIQRVESFLGGFATGFRQARAEVEQHAEETLRNNEALGKMTDSLRQRTTALGASNVALAQEAIASQSGAHADDEHARALLAAARALDQRTAALKAAAEYQAHLAADDRYIQSLTQQLEIYGLSSDAVTLYKAAVEAADAVDKHHADTILAKAAALADLQRRTADTKAVQDEVKAEAQVQSAYDQVLASVDRVAAANLQYQKSVIAVDAAVKAGIITQQQATEVEKKLADARDESINKNKEYEQALHSLFEGMASDAAGFFADMFVHGAQDAGKKLMQEEQNLAKQLAEFWIKQKIIIPFEKQMKGEGSGPAGSDVAMGAIGLGGQLVGGAVGGQTGGIISGAASGAVTGAEIGSIIPVIGTAWGAAIGAVLGGIMGALSSASQKTPEVHIGQQSVGQDTSFTDELGTTRFFSKHSNLGADQQIKQQIASFDDALANLIPADLIDEVRSRVEAINKTYKGASVEDIEADRLDAVMSVVMPDLQQFVDGLSGVQQRLAAFQGLLKIQDELKNFGSVIVQLSGTPVERITDQLKQLDDGIVQAQGKLDTAIKAQDPTAIIAAEQNLKQQILARYQTEIQMVQQLQATLHALEQASYSLNLTIAQKIAALNGDQSGVVSTALGGLQQTQGEINTSDNAQQTLDLLQQFIGQVDTWLSAAIAQVDAATQAQIDAIEKEKSAIQSEIAAEQAAAQRQMQISADIARINDEAHRKALQRQLELAKAWADVLSNAEKTVQALMTGTANPLGGYSQADNLEAIIRDLTARVNSEHGKQQAADANTLIGDLQQRLQLIQSGNLYDRSSPQYLQQYNATLAQLNAIEKLAQPEASQVDILQKQLDHLGHISVGVSQTVTISKSEQDKLDALNKKEEDLKAQEKDQIDKLNAQALAYYQWAQGEAQAAEQKRHDELMAQLKAITGGLDPQSFIAQETAKEVSLLDSIESELQDFLSSISSNIGTGTGGGSGNHGGGGGGGGGGNQPAHPKPGDSGTQPITVNLTTTVHGTGMGSHEIAAAVRSGLTDVLPTAIPAIKRALKAA